MGNFYKQRINEYFSFFKKDRDGVMVLIILIILTIVGNYIISGIDLKPRYDTSKIKQTYEEWERKQKRNDFSPVLFKFNPNNVSQDRLDSLSIPEFVKKNIIRYRNAGGSFVHASDLRKIYGMNDSIYQLLEPYLMLPDKSEIEKDKEQNFVIEPFVGNFDPNYARPEELARFGFNKFQISNIVRYRNRGGIFTKPNDVLKIYGVDSAFYRSIKKHINIEKALNSYAENNSVPKVCVELNTADSLDLIQLKGIGPVFASRIIKYRNLLGGFYSKDQLLEVYGFPEETFTSLKDNFSVDTLEIEKLRINFVEFADLIRHPYLKRENVQAILNYRQNNGPLLNEKQILINGLLDSVSYKNMKPYLTCR